MTVDLCRQRAGISATLIESWMERKLGDLRCQLPLHPVTEMRAYGKARAWRVSRHPYFFIGSVNDTSQLPPCPKLEPIQQLNYLSLIVSGFHEPVNLMSSSFADVFVFHNQKQHVRSKSLENFVSSVTQKSVDQSCTTCLNLPYYEINDKQDKFKQCV